MDYMTNSQAAEVFATLCTALDQRGWSYHRDNDKLCVSYDVNGEDMLMNFVVMVDAQHQLIRLMSPLPFQMSPQNRVNGAVAAAVVTNRLADGSFDYDVREGKVTFRLTACFTDSTIGTELVQYMIFCACQTVDKFNSQFLAIEQGRLNIDDFIRDNT